MVTSKNANLKKLMAQTLNE